MNIRNVGVTTKGWAVGEGEIKLTGNIPDQIALKPHKHVCLHVGDDTVRIIPCSFDKDHASGFFPHPDEQMVFSFEQGAKTKIKEIFIKRLRGQEVDENEPCVGSLELIEQLSMVPEENQKQNFPISDITVLSEVEEGYTKICVKGKVSYGRGINALGGHSDELSDSVSIIFNLYHSTNKLIFGNSFTGYSGNVSAEKLNRAKSIISSNRLNIENAFSEGSFVWAYKLGNSFQKYVGEEWRQISIHSPYYCLNFSSSAYLIIEPKAFDNDAFKLCENHLVFRCLSKTIFSELLESGSKFQYSIGQSKDHPNGLGTHSQVTGYNALSMGGEGRREITKLEMEGELNASGLSLKLFLNLSDIVPEQDGSIVGKPGLMDYTLSFLINWETLVVSGFNVYPYIDKYMNILDGKSGAVSKVLDQALQGLKRPFKYLN